mgnify:CR=1 FL=1
MKGLRSIPRILKVNGIEGYKASLLFNNGESRIVDFYRLLHDVFGLRAGRIGFELLEDPRLFSSMKVMGTSIGWEGVGLESINEHGEKEFYPYELDPIVLYENSIADGSRDLLIGMKVREARKAAGLTQEELAKRSGTTKYYISKLENNKSDIELMTLQKIVEAGLGKELQITIK